MSAVLRFPAVGHLADAIASTVHREVDYALSRHGGNRAATALYLGVSRRYLAEFLVAHPRIAARYPGAAGRPRKPAP